MKIRMHFLFTRWATISFHSMFVFTKDGSTFITPICRCIVGVFPMQTMAHHFPLLYIYIQLYELLYWGLYNNTFITNTPHRHPKKKTTTNPPTKKPPPSHDQPTIPQTPKALLPWPCSSTCWPWTRACGTTVVPSRHRRRRRWCAAWPGKCNGAVKRRHQRLRGALGGSWRAWGWWSYI